MLGAEASAELHVKPQHHAVTRHGRAAAALQERNTEQAPCIWHEKLAGIKTLADVEQQDSATVSEL